MLRKVQRRTVYGDHPKSAAPSIESNTESSMVNDELTL